MDVSNKLKAVALLQSMGAEDPGASSCISRTAFVQHDPAIADGFAGFEAWLRQLPASAKVDVIRAFQDGDYVFTHSLYDLGERKAGIDIFRFQDGEIVEHWDNFQKMEAPNPSGRTLLDGATELVDLDRSEQNKSIVTDFLTTHLMNGSDEISRFFKAINTSSTTPVFRMVFPAFSLLGKPTRKRESEPGLPESTRSWQKGTSSWPSARAMSVMRTSPSTTSTVCKTERLPNTGTFLRL